MELFLPFLRSTTVVALDPEIPLCHSAPLSLSNLGGEDFSDFS